MTLNLKIEILKVFSLEFSMNSDKNKKEQNNAKTGDDAPAAKPK